MSELAFQRKKFVTPQEAARILGASLDNTYLIVSRLEEKGWLERVERGKYLTVPLEGKEGWAEHPFLCVPGLVQPYYISYRTALAHYGWTEQIPYWVFVCTTKRKRDKSFQGYFYKFVTLKRSKFFGFTELELDHAKINIAEREKLIVDCLDRERYAGGIVEVTKALDAAKDEIDSRRLIDYAIRMSSHVLCRRLGYLLDLLELGHSEVLLDHLGTFRPAWLSTVFEKEELYRDRRWRLRVNASKEDLLSWRKVL